MNPHRNYYASFALALVLALIALPDVVHAKSVYVIGDEEHPWDEVGAVLEGMDIASHPGWIVPEQVDPERNLLSEADTWIWWEPQEELRNLWTESGVAPDAPMRVWTAFVDLEGLFGVHSVRFFTSSWGTHLPLWEIEVGVNEGDPEDRDVYGLPILEGVWSGKVDPEQAWVEVHFPTHSARYVGVLLRARVPDFSIRDMQVYGEGFVAQSRYRSPVLDLERVSDLGQIRWKGNRDAEARIVLRTRTGTDEDPNLYWRKTEKEELSPLDASGEALTRETYERLPLREQGGITLDREHWSFWSAPYPFEQGEAGVWMASPSPRRYVQIQIELWGDYQAQRGMDFVSFEYSQPALAQKVLGEIAPTEVRASERTTFHYAITPVMERGDRGFDTLEIYTPIRVDTVRSVRWDGAEMPLDVEYLSDPTRFAVHFPRVEEPLLLIEVDFDVSVLRYGTMFRGRVSDSTVDEMPQWVVPGDADFAVESSTLSVQTVLSEPLIASMKVAPNPFTPNGDGVNDEAWIGYDLLQLTEDAPVRVQVYDLSGRLIRTIYSGKDRSDRYRRRWDGKDALGALVSPGVYLIYVSVQGDAIFDSKVRTLMVSY